MADLILACPRAGRPAFAAERLRRAALRLAPPEVPLREPLLLEAAGCVAAVANPTVEGVFLHGGEGESDRPPGGGACVGGLFGTPGDWWRTGSSAPEGTYALVRWDADTVELLSDICASRTLWYAHTEEAFLASTSQRALVMLLGGLRLDHAAVAWLLSSGTSGPESAWDTRVHVLPADSRLALDRVAWRSQVDHRPAVFSPASRDGKAHVAALRDAIAATCAELGLDLSQWLLPLSGGLDSRLILAGMARAGETPRCITWTTPASVRDPISDARIAPLVARHFGAEHRQIIISEPEGGPDWALDRFVYASEGRTDELAGYLDGCAVWRDLAREGESGVIRGDESAGERKRDAHDDGSRRGGGAIMVEDYDDGHVIRRLGLTGQEWPARLHRQDGESPEQYCDRMSQQVYVPMVLGPLNSLKARYLEIVNPLLARRVIGAARELPDELRMYGRAIHRVAGSACPWIPYARTSSLADTHDYLSRPDVIEVLVRELTSQDMARVLSEESAARLLVAMAVADRTPATLRTRIFSAIKAGSIVLPARTYDRLAPRYDRPEELGGITLALRATIASKTITLLGQDAALLREPASATRGD